MTRSSSSNFIFFCVELRNGTVDGKARGSENGVRDRIVGVVN